MVTRLPLDKKVEQFDRIPLYMQAGDLVEKECKQYIESTKLVIQANKVAIEVHRIRLEAGRLGREIRHKRKLLPDSPDLDALEMKKHALQKTADELQAQAVQLLTQAMRLRATLAISTRGR